MFMQVPEYEVEIWRDTSSVSEIWTVSQSDLEGFVRVLIWNRPKQFIVRLLEIRDDVQEDTLRQVTSE